jgi:molybdopterin adenylyltransferase
VLAAALTISTSKAAGDGLDESGPQLVEIARGLGATTVEREVISDRRELIEAKLRELCDRRDCAVVLTSGGTGVARDDVTPEATRAVLDREIPGIGEALRLASRPHTTSWMLSRATAGIRGHSLIVNLPGSPAAVAQLGGELTPALRHALELIAGRTGHHVAAAAQTRRPAGERGLDARSG